MAASTYRQHLQLATWHFHQLGRPLASARPLVPAAGGSSCVLQRSPSAGHPVSQTICLLVCGSPVQAYKHEAILGLHVCFVHEIHLWMVMPYMEVRAAAAASATNPRTTNQQAAAAAVGQESGGHRH